MADKVHEGEVVSGLPTSGGALELVTQGAVVMRVENDTMMSVAIQRPRDEGKVIAGALKELELAPEFAEKAWYSIPRRQRQDDGTYKIVKIEGPSVKAAMALARRWGNCSASARVLNEDKEGYDVEGVFLDLETNFRISRPQRVSKWYKPRAGGAALLTVDAQLMALQSGASKAIRNAVLSGLPAYLVSAYDKKARALAGGKLDAPAEQKTKDSVVHFYLTRYKVSVERLEKYLELPITSWTGSEIADLRGLANALGDQHTTVEEAFGPIDGAPAGTNGAGAPAGSTGTSTVSPESLAGGKTTAENNVQPEAKKETPPPTPPVAKPEAAAQTPPPTTQQTPPAAESTPATPAPAFGDEERPMGPAAQALFSEDTEKAETIVALDQVLEGWDRRPPEALWNAMVKEICGVATVQEAGLDVLKDLLTMIRGVKAKKKGDVARANAIVDKFNKGLVK